MLGRPVRNGKAATAVGLAVCGLLVASADGAQARAEQSAVGATFSGPLTNFNTAESAPFDSATAVLRVVETTHGTNFLIQVAGIDPAAAGSEFGAHLHTGPCVKGNGAAAGPHYNSDQIAGVTPPEVNSTTEVWLNLKPNPAGKAVDEARVPFVPKGGERSIVIHAAPTSPTGTAGARIACLPVSLP